MSYFFKDHKIKTWNFSVEGHWVFGDRGPIYRELPVLPTTRKFWNIFFCEAFQIRKKFEGILHTNSVVSRRKLIFSLEHNVTNYLKIDNIRVMQRNLKFTAHFFSSSSQLPKHFRTISFLFVLKSTLIKNVRPQQAFKVGFFLHGNFREFPTEIRNSLEGTKNALTLQYFASI